MRKKLDLFPLFFLTLGAMRFGKMKNPLSTKKGPLVPGQPSRISARAFQHQSRRRTSHVNVSSDKTIFLYLTMQHDQRKFSLGTSKLRTIVMASCLTSMATTSSYQSSCQPHHHISYYIMSTTFSPSSWEV